MGGRLARDRKGPKTGGARRRCQGPKTKVPLVGDAGCLGIALARGWQTVTMEAADFQNTGRPEVVIHPFEQIVKNFARDLVA